MLIPFSPSAVIGRRGETLGHSLTVDEGVDTLGGAFRHDEQSNPHQIASTPPDE